MKLNSSVSKFLTNKWVLNIIALLALFNVIGYMVMGNINAILYFVVFAVLVRYFSKNMTVVLGVPLIVVNLLAMRDNILEGMENNTSTTNNTNTTSQTQKTSDKENADQKKIDAMVNNNKNKPDPKTGQGLPMQPLEHASDNVATQSTGGEQQGFEAGRSKNRGYNIDYATTIEDAYDELNNILGGDGIQRLTSDTQGLMKQQMQLAEAMKNIEPMVKTMVPMVEQLKGMMGQMDNGKDGLGGIMKLAQQFAGKSAPAQPAK